MPRLTPRRALLVAAGSIATLIAGPIAAEPIDPSPVDCLGPAPEAEPGTPEWEARDAQNASCTEQRRLDQALNPATPLPDDQPTNDAYREPSRHHGARFRYTPTTVGAIAAEVYRPCAAGTCAALPAELATFEPPYPAVIVLHGGSSRKEYHWWASQTFAEAGYFVVALDSTSAGPAAVSWLNDPSNPWADEIDTDRVGIAAHSIGGQSAAGRQGDPRVSAILIWDGVTATGDPGTSTTVSADPTHVTPTLYEFSEGGFAFPTPHDSSPGPVKATGFATLRGRGVDTMVVSGRATSHVDFTGGELSGNRYAELVWSYFGLAWFDRHLKGKLVLSGSETPEQEAAERSHRQAIAQEAYDRLTATHFDGSARRHSISQGFWDPDLAVASGDPVYGGNVPYRLDGLPIADRLSFYERSVCFVSVPDYVSGGSGAPGDPVAERSDTTPDGDMRRTGCAGLGEPSAPLSLLSGALACDQPLPDAEPGTQAYLDRDSHNMACSEQRHADYVQHPGSVPTPDALTTDWYRIPTLHDGVRFRYQLTTIDGLEVEIYRPCAAGACANRPASWPTFAPPYPAVTVHHGCCGSVKEQLWWASQQLADAGYLVIAVDSTGSQGALLDWLLDPGNPLSAEVDAARIGTTGHSAGGGSATTAGHSDPRIAAIVAWDANTPDGVANPNKPELWLLADYTSPVWFPQPYPTPPNPVRTSGFADLRNAGIDAMRVALRASTHLDFIPSRLAGGRYTELVSAYYTLAWFDRHLKGKVVLTGAESPEQARAERTRRESIARDAFARLTAAEFDDSVDRNNISQGFWDQAQAEASGDLVYGGNVPYRIEGKNVSDRLSFYFTSSCFLSVPGSDELRVDSADMREGSCTALPEPGAAASLAAGAALVSLLARRRNPS